MVATTTGKGRKATPKPAKTVITSKVPVKKAAPKKAAAKRVSRPRVQVDTRTRNMSAAALICRSIGHRPVVVPTPPAVRIQHMRNGERVLMIRCENGCTYFRNLICDAYTGALIKSTSDYEDKVSYCNPDKGTGRIPRAAARAAMFAMQD